MDMTTLVLVSLHLLGLAVLIAVLCVNIASIQQARREIEELIGPPGSSFKEFEDEQARRRLKANRRPGDQE